MKQGIYNSLLIAYSCILFYNCTDKKEIKEYYPNGKIKKQYSLINEKVEGEVFLYDSTGTLSSSHLYVNGKANGRAYDYYPSGKIKEIFYETENHANGKVLRYYENGQISLIGKYINDRFNGIVKEYYSNGKIESIVLQYKGASMTSNIYDSLTGKPKWGNIIFDLKGSDTISAGEDFNAEIITMNMGKVPDVRYENLHIIRCNKIDSVYVPMDTINIITPINDSIYKIHIPKPALGRNIWTAVFCAKEITDTVLYFRTPIVEQFYVKP